MLEGVGSTIDPCGGNDARFGRMLLRARNRALLVAQRLARLPNPAPVRLHVYYTGSTGRYPIVPGHNRVGAVPQTGSAAAVGLLPSAFDGCDYTAVALAIVDPVLEDVIGVGDARKDEEDECRDGRTEHRPELPARRSAASDRRRCVRQLPRRRGPGAGTRRLSGRHVEPARHGQAHL